MKHSGRIEVRNGLQAISDAARAYRSVWESACKHDGIESNSKFVVFSDDNPYTQFIGPALNEYHARITEYRSGGYVGLSMAKEGKP